MNMRVGNPVEPRHLAGCSPNTVVMATSQQLLFVADNYSEVMTRRAAVGLPKNEQMHRSNMVSLTRTIGNFDILSAVAVVSQRDANNHGFHLPLRE